MIAKALRLLSRGIVWLVLALILPLLVLADNDFSIQVMDQTHFDCPSSFGGSWRVVQYGTYTVFLPVDRTCPVSDFGNGFDMTGLSAGYYYMVLTTLSGYPRATSTPFYWDGGAFLTDTSTHIIDLKPQQGTTTPSAVPVDFSLQAYINENDLGIFKGVNIYLRNIDQNVLFSYFLSPSDIVFLDDSATTSGMFYYASSTILGDGNYRITARLEKDGVAGLNILNPYFDTESHQFVVGTSTFMGNIRQQGYNEFQNFIASTTATSTQAMANNCNPLSSAFDIRLCATYLIVPDTEKLQETLQYAKESILYQFPLGYVTRFIDILSSEATSSLPGFTVHIRTGENSTTTLAFDMADTIAGGGQLLNTIQDPINGKNIKDIFEPFVKLAVTLAVLFTIFSDIMGSHKHAPTDKRTQSQQV